MLIAVAPLSYPPDERALHLNETLLCISVTPRKNGRQAFEQVAMRQIRQPVPLWMPDGLALQHQQ